MSTNPELKRVGNNLDDIVFRFCHIRFLHYGGEFTASLLETNARTEFIGDDERAAPGSPMRVLRSLRQRGAVSYSVVSRTHSKYRITAVDPSKL